MKTEELETVEKFLAALNKLFETITNNESLIYLLGIIIVLIFAYVIIKMLLDFFGGKRIDKAIDKNSEMLGRVHTALLTLSNK